MFEKYSYYKTEKGEELICYEITDQFAFMCPYIFQDNGDITFNIKETKVYSVDDPEQTGMSAIDTMICTPNETEESE